MRARRVDLPSRLISVPSLEASGLVRGGLAGWVWMAWRRELGEERGRRRRRCLRWLRGARGLGEALWRAVLSLRREIGGVWEDGWLMGVDGGLVVVEVASGTKLGYLMRRMRTWVEVLGRGCIMLGLWLLELFALRVGPLLGAVLSVSAEEACILSRFSYGRFRFR